MRQMVVAAGLVLVLSGCGNPPPPPETPVSDLMQSEDMVPVGGHAKDAPTAQDYLDELRSYEDDGKLSRRGLEVGFDDNGRLVVADDICFHIEHGWPEAKILARFANVKIPANEAKLYIDSAWRAFCHSTTRRF